MNTVYTLQKIQESLRNKTLSIRDVVLHTKKVIEEKDKNIHAFLGIYSDTFIENQIKKAEKMFEEGKETALTGIPIAVKDSILVNGEKATGASKILEYYVATYDADVIEALKDAGAILIGRTNLDEFCIGGSTENSAYGVTKNPHDITKVSGGSSGGSAASVAYGAVPLALGSDTGGSVRQPASFCGVVGLKTTYGVTSRYGTMAMGSSLDQIGYIGNTVSDVEALYTIASRYDSKDATSIPIEKRKAQYSSPLTLRKKIGVPWSFIRCEGIDKEVLVNFEEKIKAMEKNGYEIVDITIPYLEKSLSVYYIVMFAEVSSNMSRYDGIRYGLSLAGENNIAGYSKSRTAGFGDEVRRRILLGTYILSAGYYDAYYNKAQKVRASLKSSFIKTFSEVDIIAMPTSPVPAFGIGEKHGDPLSMYLADIFTVPVNIVGVPAISVPSGKTEKGLPLGIQFIGEHYGESTVFAYGKALEDIY